MRLIAAVLAFGAPLSGQIVCSYAVTPTRFTIGSQAYTAPNSISVTPTGSSFCNGWNSSVAPGLTWLHITPPGNGNGPGTVSWSADANPAGVERQGIMTVAGLTVTVTQTAKPCSFAASPVVLATPEP